MAVTISAALNLDGFLTWVTLNGLTPGTKYDVYRLQMRYTGDNDLGFPTYHRELPDRRKLWSSVGHRIGWTAPAASVRFRDYEPFRRPFSYFVVQSSLIGPAEYAWRNNDGPYPISRGVLDSQVVHFARAASGATAAMGEGEILVRSSWEIGLWQAACVYDLDIGYKSRGAELAVMGREDPLFIADTRESRRGTLTILTTRMGQYLDMRRMLFPNTGLIRPVMLQGDNDGDTLLLDDLDIIPLNVQVEQATPRDPDARYIHIEFIETDATGLKLQRAADLDNPTPEPVADFTISDNTPARGDWVTLTDDSTGTLDEYDWTLSEKAWDNRLGKFNGDGPHKVRFNKIGRKFVKLRVNGPKGADVKTREIDVHP